jgi:hypothetical protein
MAKNRLDPASIKPRLSPLLITEEDMRIWTRPARYAYDSSFPLSRHQDRSDAELMLQAQRIAACGPAAIQLEGIDCRGWDEDWEIRWGIP